MRSRVESYCRRRQLSKKEVSERSCKAIVEDGAPNRDSGETRTTICYTEGTREVDGV